MRDLRIWFLSMLGIGFFTIANAHINPELHKAPVTNNSNTVNYRSDCDQATQKIDMAINNVRARLLTGGDVWWDPGSAVGRYIVPKVPVGQPEVSSIYAGAVWLGGYDPANNLKLAAQQYGSTNGNADFWPGPLDPDTGETEQDVCAQWDKFFVVKGEDIDEHIRNFEKAEAAGTPYAEGDIPKSIKGWPARGNQFFFDIHQFELPNTAQGLGAFFDKDSDTFYEPDEGDYPIIEVRGCEAPQYPDEMTFWIYNDAGNIHSESNADPIQMEVQVQAFAYATNDEINNMTFQRYKLINRAIESIDSTYFAMWVDADLGCHADDYIGCDTLRSLAFIYNADAQDGETGCNCGTTNTYCTDIPIIGVDYFRGPLDENGKELGMSSFTYYNNGSVGNPTPGTTDPGTPEQFYNYLSGSWLNGQPFEEGGDAFMEGTTPIDYAFIAPPNDPIGWSMCTAAADNSPDYDRRTVQASGPFRLDPGAVNELIVGAVWIADQDYPCPSIRSLQAADDVAQALFNNCFDITDGPDAPDVDIVELDQELILILTNDLVTSNNAFESYAEVGLNIPDTADDSLYLFEGYKVFQFSGPDVTLSDLDNPDKVRVIAQVDVKNNVEKLYNWVNVESSLDEAFFSPVLKNDGVQNEGIEHSFRVTEDQFAIGTDRRLVNHKRYYFATIAYAHNNYEGYNPNGGIGQRLPYLEGRKNIGDGTNPFYTAIPRPIVTKTLNAAYGDGAIITRVDGLGAGGNFLDMNDATKASILDGTFNGEIVYKPGAGPIEVKVVNPLEVTDGDFLLTLEDDNLSDDELDPSARWKLIEVNNPDEPIFSETTISKANEQVLAQYGFSLTVAQTADTGDGATDANGAIGYRGVYPPNSVEWFAGTPDGFSLGIPNIDPFYDFAKTRSGEKDEELDPKQALTQLGGGFWVPYTLADWSANLLTPAWQSGGSIVRNNNGVEKLNNVDIVFTSDKSKWSRACIVDTYTDELAGATLLPPLTENPEVDEVKSFDVRQSPSVGKEDADGDGLPDPDGDGYGMGWFPGYAVDVETGQRLNIFFGENSVYRPALNDEFGGAPLLPSGFATGADMMYNPTSQLLIDPSLTGGLFTASKLHVVNGGQHHIYVSRTAYDECAAIRDRLEPSNSSLRKVKAMQNITWTSMSFLQPGAQMLSYADGLIPADFTAQLRVDNPYQVEVDEDNSADKDTRTGTGEFDYYPAYRFKLEGVQATEQSTVEIDAALDLINVVPNPYYGYSSYETSQFSTIVKITNLPAKATITIYSLDGKFIRQYNRNEVPSAPAGGNRGIQNRQITPDIEWDLKNNKGIPVASGVYLIHVDAGELGQRTLKWFGVARQYDPSGL